MLTQVRFVQADAIQKQLNGGHIVLLGNLAYSAAGEVLNCDCYSVATQAAIDLQADKLFCLTTPSLQPFDLPHWLPISDAERLLTSLLESTNEGQPEQSSGVHKHAFLAPQVGFSGSSTVPEHIAELSRDSDIAAVASRRCCQIGWCCL